MKTVLRIFLYLVIMVVVVLVGFVGFIQLRGIPKYEVKKIDYPQVQYDSAMIAHGQKIAAVQCVACHRGGDGKLSGRLLNELPPDFGEIHSANITQSKENGIGNWTDEQIAYLLRTGVKPDGQFLPAYMPKFPHMSEYDLKCIIAFLRSGTPVVQPSEIAKIPSKPSFLTKFLCLVAFKEIPYPATAIPEPDTSNAVEFGKYLVVGRYDCYPCHSADFKTLNQAQPELSGGFLGGGNKMVSLDGKERLTANITFDEETGIGRWTLDDFRNAMINSKSKDGHALRDPMLPYNGMTETEIKSIYAYLQTVPKIKNKVDRKWDQD
ncbi:MAG TPA: c-type cytochrome [Chitinophagales bacterium]|nr:c-type cytochrome [Chitinophagales bacterium]